MQNDRWPGNFHQATPHYQRGGLSVAPFDNCALFSALQNLQGAFFAQLDQKIFRRVSDMTPKQEQKQVSLIRVDRLYESLRYQQSGVLSSAIADQPRPGIVLINHHHFLDNIFKGLKFSHIWHSSPLADRPATSLNCTHFTRSLQI